MKVPHFNNFAIDQIAKLFSIMARIKEFDENEVLDRAVALFWTKGYNGTSAQDIVETLGISRSSLYDTFGDKRTLFLKALQRYRTKMSGAMIQMIEQSTNAAQTIKQIFQNLVNESLDSNVPKGCFMINSTVELAPHDQEIADIIHGNAQDVEDALCAIIKKGQEAGQFTSKANPRSLARFFYNNISGLRVAARSGADKKLMADIIKHLLASLN